MDNKREQFVRTIRHFAWRQTTNIDLTTHNCEETMGWWDAVFFCLG